MFVTVWMHLQCGGENSDLLRSFKLPLHHIFHLNIFHSVASIPSYLPIGILVVFISGAQQLLSCRSFDSDEKMTDANYLLS